ncbi:MAG: discoidin domain-containing protein [Verrucomicrobia bacterium]|nr:discoidin domain-containing protein [Verrucomicrobiota bacterium]
MNIDADMKPATAPGVTALRSTTIWTPSVANALPAILAIGLGLIGISVFVVDAEAEPAPQLSPQELAPRIERSWLLEEQLLADTRASAPVTTQEDAAGACDGVKTGQWGFHTGLAKEPWWQVDLGELQPLTRVVIWNRCDAPERATKLVLLVSPDAKTWSTAYRHTNGLFFGFTDKKPLTVSLSNTPARYVRVQLPGETYLHLDEVEVFGTSDPARNLALRRPADQVSVSSWSSPHDLIQPRVDWPNRTRAIVANCRRLADERRAAGLDVDALEIQCGKLEALAAHMKVSPKQLGAEAEIPPPTAYLEARRLQRQLALSNPLLDFDALLFTKRVPPSFNHMSDQYYGWWSKPGGGIYVLRDFKTAAPKEECLTASFREPGSFLRPTLSYDGRKILFAWCRHYPKLADETNKLDKQNVPEDAFYHLFEMNADGSGLRRLTTGKYDDFDGRYLPDGRMVFLSTRRGQSIQAGVESAARTQARADLPDCYVRCGGGPDRPVAVYTLHTMNADGSAICAISPFEMFEWTPEIARDGSVIYSRWDYIDRDNMPYMGLWAINPDGSNARMVYKNYSRAPYCTFEAKPIPGSHKLVFTASAHHAQTMGSLVLLDPSASLEGEAPITRLTPEVPFPEIEGWPKSSYANPWPLSERHYLVAWGCEGKQVPGPGGWDRWHAVQRPTNGMDVYYFDAAVGRELLWFDPAIGCGDPIPLRARPRPPVLSGALARDASKEGRFFLADVYQGLKTVQRGGIKALRIVAVPAKTHPTMNYPSMGVTRDDPGKCVLGTVPVEPDGSAYFRVPAGVIVFFQALDAEGMAVQTMRSVSHVQPGQTLSCIGCHEHRQQAPPVRMAMATTREPSRITPGPDGSWNYRFDVLVQPVLDRHCVACHGPDSKDPKAARFDLVASKSYETLVRFGKPSLQDLVWQGYRRGHSTEGEGLARRSPLLPRMTDAKDHADVQLDPESRERLIIWMDTYAQRLGAFSLEQDKDLEELRRSCSALLSTR